VAEAVGDELQGVLNPLGVNCIRVFPGRGLRVYGARTLAGDPDWRFLSIRRLLLMIEEAVEESVQWAVFEPNDIALRQALKAAISGFLRTLWERGALAGATPDEAFFVRCDEENNPPAVVDLGQVIATVGVAPVYPAEFVVFRIGRTADELEVREVQGGGPW
jgi:phage tail sheath protein FI